MSNIKLKELIDLEFNDSNTILFDTKCNNCPAPCCTFRMTGITYNEVPNLNSYIDFFTYNFVLIPKKDLVSIYHDLALCPLNILGNCLIYENRPKVCQIWNCLIPDKRREDN